MAAFSVLPPSRAGKISLLGVNGYDLHIGADNEEIELPACRVTLSGFQDHSSLKHGRSRYEAASRCGDCRQEFLTLRLTKKDGCEGGRINDHVGVLDSAREPVLVVA